MPGISRFGGAINFAFFGKAIAISASVIYNHNNEYFKNMMIISETRKEFIIMERIYLFDGTSMDKWKKRGSNDPCGWILENGVMTVVRGQNDIVSTETFGDAHIHVEWMEPDMPDKTGQNKGNSGVYIHGCYELQVLDSYGVEEPKNNDCGSFYEMYAPLVNACKPALEWQTYDIYFRAPRFNEDGSVKENAFVTVVQNGIMIQNNIELYQVTPGGITDGKQVAEGPLMLQDHGNPVSYRNVYIEKY